MHAVFVDLSRVVNVHRAYLLVLRRTAEAAGYRYQSRLSIFNACLIFSLILQSNVVLMASLLFFCLQNGIEVDNVEFREVVSVGRTCEQVIEL